MTDCFQFCFKFAFKFKLRRYTSVLVPSPNVAEDHQTFNAVEMENTGWDRCHPH
jgi:hypothetical protein